MIRRLKSARKGVGTAMGAVFFIALLLAAIITVKAIDAYQTRYLQAREEMVEWDIKRISEDLEIVGINNPSTDSGYKFDIIMNNEAHETASIVRIYIYDNENETLWGLFDEQIIMGGYGFTNGDILPGEKGHVIKINAESTLKNSTMHLYGIVICTERGRQFSYVYPPLSSYGAGAGGGGFSLLIAADHDNFQYKVLDMNFTSAYVKNHSTYQTLYRILVNNTTNKKIYLWNNCTMLHFTAQPENQRERFIVSNQSSSALLLAFENETIDSNSTKYLYFAASQVGGNDWQTEPGAKGYYIIGLLIWFRYEGESEVRSIGLPTFMQKLEEPP